MVGYMSALSLLRKLRAGLLAMAFFIAPTIALAAQPPVNQLVMFEQAGCPFCAAWNHDIGGIYGKTDEAKLLRLRRVDIHVRRPSDLVAIAGVIYTPTFIVLHCGQEVQRIVGYSGAEQFWELLDIGVQKVHSQPKTCTATH